LSGPPTPVAASATLNPAGTNNNIVVTALETGVAGNDLTVEVQIDSSGNRVLLTIAKDKNDTLVFCGDKRWITITGITFPTASNPIRLEFLDFLNGKPHYVLESASPGVLWEVFHNRTAWVIRLDEGEDYLATVTSSASFPDGLTYGTPSVGTGTPSVSASAAQSAQVIELINNRNDLPIFASSAAGNDGTGAIATIAKTSLIGGVGLSAPYAIA
jgi:hypothetical protein